MSLLIGDGKGGAGGLWQIKANRGQVDADVHTALEEHSEKGDAYVWHAVSYSFSNADTLMAIRNIHPTKLLHIDKVIISVQAATQAQFHMTAGSAALAGTVVTGFNLNRASGNVAQADARVDETTNSAQGTRFLTLDLAALTHTEFDFEGALILQLNDAMGIDGVDAGTSFELSILGFFNLPR